MADNKGSHRWTFHRVGGLDQVALDEAADLRNLESLDQKLWVALSCPTRGLELDTRTLELLDLDKDGRVRAPEIIAAVKWCDARLRDVGSLIPGKPALALADVDGQRPEGRALLGAAARILAAAKKPDAREITPADVADLTGVFAGTDFNGDGVVPPEAAGADAATRQLLADAIACAGSETDRSGRPGIDQKRLDSFFAELAAFAEWAAQGESPAVAVLGAGTAAAHAAVEGLRAKADDFFVRCRLAAMDPRGAALLNRTDAEFQALASKDLAAAAAEVAAFPVARIEAGRALPLGEGVNPAWAGPAAALGAVLGGKKELTGAEWEELKARLAPYRDWLGARKGGSVEKLGLPRVRALLAEGKARAEALLAQDRALEAESNAVADVVRMVHYQRDLYRLLRNFVSFADFYNPRVGGIFQVGTLYLDARSCDLCIRVDDPGAHSALAGLSRIYVAYCDLRRPAGETMKIAACFTQGDADYLRPGRNGIFYDRQGRDWDATITRIVENPISIRQAFWSPYKKLARMIEDQVAKFAAAKEKEADARLATVAAGTADAATAKAPPKAEPVDVGKMVGIIAALGVGAGAIGTLFGGFVSGFLSLQPWWAKVAAIAGAVLVISGPAMLIAWLKLRQRTLGPVLDANGWAINGRVKLNIPLGSTLTALAALPRNATRSLTDPYEDQGAKRRRRLLALLVVVAIAALGVARYRHTWPFGPR